MVKLGKQRGFTIVELIVVIAIMAILISITFMGFNHLNERTAIHNDKALVNQINRVLSGYEIYSYDETKIATSLVEEFGEEIIVESYEFGYDVYYNTDIGEFELLYQSFGNTRNYKNLAYFLNLNHNLPTPPDTDDSDSELVIDLINIDGRTENLQININLETPAQSVTEFKLSELGNISNPSCESVKVVNYNNFSFEKDFVLNEDDSTVYFYRPGIYLLTYTLDNQQDYRVIIVENLYITQSISNPINIDATNVNCEAIIENSSVKIEISNYLLGIFITEFNQSDFGTGIYNLSADSSFMENIDIIVRIKDTYKYVTMDSDKTTAENYEFSFEDVEVEEGDNIEITFRYFGFDGRWHYYSDTLEIN